MDLVNTILLIILEPNSQLAHNEAADIVQEVGTGRE